MAEIGYKIPYKGNKYRATDIGNIAVPGYSSTLAPCVYFGKAGFITDNKIGVDDNKFLAVNSYDPWKTGIDATKYYKSSRDDEYSFTNDIASISSCPNFKKVIGFYGDGTQPNSAAIKVFKRGKTYRLQVRRESLNDSFLISIVDNDATNNSNLSDIGRWRLERKTGKLPTALIVGIQAAGGSGNSFGVGAGGGGGACAYFVLDWEQARQKINKGGDSILFDFYITPITGWKAIAYDGDKTSTTCSNSCVAINLDAIGLTDDSSASGTKKKVKSKCIVGCGQDAYETIAGKAGVVKNYDLGDDTFGIDTGKIYTDGKLSEYGIHKLTMHQSGDEVLYAGNGGGIGSAGFGSNRYWLTTTNSPIPSDFEYPSDVSDVYYQFEPLLKHNGGSAETYGGGGGGASNFADGGKGGATGTGKGTDGTLGSGGGGGYRGDSNDGKGGLPYIFFCSNIDFSIAVLEYPDIKLSSTLKEGYSAASSDTYIAYLQKNGDTSGEKIFIYPSTTSIPYPTGCDASNTYLYRNSGYGGWRSPVLMSNISLNTEYATYNDSNSNPHWYYNIVFTKK